MPGCIKRIQIACGFLPILQSRSVVSQVHPGVSGDMGIDAFDIYSLIDREKLQKSHLAHVPLLVFETCLILLLASRWPPPWNASWNRPYHL